MEATSRFLLLAALLSPGALSAAEAPPEAVAAAESLPVMGAHTTWTLQKGESDYVVELSGLCLSKDGDFLWGVGDNGNLCRINFDGTYESHWSCVADMEGVTIDPESGDLYIAVEPCRVYRLAPPYTDKATLFDVEEAAKMGNSGIEGIAWHGGGLYLGAQKGAALWKYSVGGDKLQGKRSLRDIAPTISEIAGLCYDPVSDRLWAIDSNSNRKRPEYLPFTLYLFNGDATELLATYPLGDFANWNPEAVCVDRARGCVWIGEDCDDDNPSLLHKVEFTGL